LLPFNHVLGLKFSSSPARKSKDVSFCLRWKTLSLSRRSKEPEVL
jgi:hypothetical protein